MILLQVWSPKRNSKGTSCDSQVSSQSPFYPYISMLGPPFSPISRLSMSSSTGVRSASFADRAAVDPPPCGAGGSAVVDALLSGHCRARCTKVLSSWRWFRCSAFGRYMIYDICSFLLLVVRPGKPPSTHPFHSSIELSSGPTLSDD